MNFPLWVNADIIQGPSFLELGMYLASPEVLFQLGNINGNMFLNLTKKYVPNATLSPGKDINDKVVLT